MRYRICLTVCLAALWASMASTQDLEELLDETEHQEEELRRLPGTEKPGLITSDADRQERLPEGEEVQRLRIAQDRQIDPETYIVGPGDVIQLYIWGEFDQDLPFEVNPEGLALVPTIGAFDVSGRTLADVKAEIIGAASRDKYPGVEITLSLQSMRFFSVYITGPVVKGEGAHVVTPVTRLSDLIDLAGGFLNFEGTITARRSVQIHHAEGPMEVVDLAMYVATGDIRHNPYLRMGDIVHIEFRQRHVFVYGAVNDEGDQEFRNGDTVDDLLRLARGIKGTAPLAQVEIWRFVEGTDSTVVITLIDQESGAIRQTVDDIADVPLQPKDMLFIRTRSDWQLTPTVFAHGQMRYTGRYRITRGETTLIDFVREAGGFTENANLLEARVIRTKARAIVDPELARLQAVLAAGGLADLTPEERAYLKSKQREQRGRLSIDFERLFLEGDESQDVFLEGGDVVFIPEKRLTVSMSGQFQKPGLVDFEAGRRGGFYLEQAGGFGFNAHKSGMRLIRARTGQREKFDKNLLVEPGDEIWVPEKQYRDWWALMTETIRTTAEALTLILLVRAI